jgi:hypothetical protein
LRTDIVLFGEKESSYRPPLSKNTQSVHVG